MPITRDEDFPADAAQLMAAFSRCAGGHDTLAVIEASANMLIAAIHGHTRIAGGTLDDAIVLARQIGTDLSTHVFQQWNRRPSREDVPVASEGN